MPIVDAAHTADDVAETALGVVPRSTPARLISDRAVRRRSCSVQPVTPLAASSHALRFDRLPIGVTPSVVNTISPLPIFRPW
jgi:hypothetical protein